MKIRISLLLCILVQSSLYAMEQILNKKDESCIQMITGLKHHFSLFVKQKITDAKQSFNKALCPLCNCSYQSRANTRRHFFTYCLPKKHPKQLLHYQSLIAEWEQEQLQKQAVYGLLAVGIKRKKSKNIKQKQLKCRKVDSDIEEIKSEHTPPPPTYDHVCFLPFCKKEFSSARFLNQHLKKDHNF